MTGTSVISYEDRFAKDAASAAERAMRPGTSLSTQGGVFSMAGQTLGSKVTCVILDSIFENNFFHPGIPYERENPMPPVCYAMGREKKDLSPHISMQAAPDWFKPQHFPCEGCPQNKWGSAPQGKGKACRNRVRLTLLPAGYYNAPAPRKPPELFLYDDPAHFAKVDAVALRLPVTSGENWSNYVTQLAASHRRPPYAVFTEITLMPDPKSQYKAHFDMVDLCPDNLFEPLVRRADATIAAPFAGFSAPEPEQLEAAANAQRQQGQQQRGGFRR